MKTATKYILASSLLAILTITLFGLYSLSQYHESEVKSEHARLETCIRTFWQLLGYKGTDFRIADGKLLAGNYTVNGNFELPDKVQEIFGGVATIFMGDERVSTNVLNGEGERALGTRLVGPAYDSIFNQGKPYRGDAAILGVTYLTAYDPIRDSRGKIIGVLFVGVKESDFLSRLHVMKTNMTLTLFALVTVFILLMLLLGRAVKRVEKANENQIRFQRTLIDTIPTPVFFKDASCRYLGCNKAFEEYVGYSRDELLGKTPHDLWSAELADSYLQQDLALLESSGMQAYEGRARSADGTLREVIFNKAAFEEGDGTVAGMVGVILDITERKNAEEATRSAYRQLLDIVEFLPDATFVVDRDKRVIAWNRAIELMTGVEKREIMGKGEYAYAIPFYNDSRPLLIDLLDQEQERLRLNYTHIKQDGQTLFTEVFVPSFRNGESRYFWATATPLFDGDGKQAGAIESIRDITEYKRAEEDKIRLESQLDYARLMETVMIRLGHDLKTPLTPLFILLPLLKNRLADPELIKKVDMCIACATSIKNLADKTRRLATLSTGATPFELEGVPLASVADQALTDCGEMITRKRIECRNSVDPGIVVRGVPDQLHELLLNLVSNAVHFSPEKGTVFVSADRHGETVVISVQDEGVGLDPTHLEHVFDEFFKADESRHDLDAPGLGLSICKRIVRNHHGRIWAESDGIGRGTTVRFTLNEQDAGCGDAVPICQKIRSFRK